MSTYFRGPVCGRDNCRSRLWRIIDGRRTCQYGHVMEGDVEFNDDEDDINSMGVVTRRLNLTTNATGSFRSTMNSQSQSSQKDNEYQKLYGSEADDLFLKCFQFILKKQCMWLIEDKKFPAVFKDVVKALWMRYLETLSQRDQQTDNREITASQRISNGRDKRIGLSLQSSISLLYLAGIHLRLPVFSCDYVRWVCSMKILFFRANLHLPTIWRKQLPNYYLQVLEGGKPPNNSQLFHKIAYTCSKLRFSQTFNSYLPLEALILKLVLLTKLPPHTYFYTKELIKLVEGDNSENFALIEHEKTRFTKLHLYAELRTVAYFIIAIKWKTLADDKFIAHYVDVWLDLEQTGSDPVSRDLAITSLSYPSPQNDVHEWSQTETEHYLHWLENHFLPGTTVGELDNLTIDQRIAKKKLYAMFPLPKDLAGDPEFKPLSFIEDTQEKYLSIADALSDKALKPCRRTTEIATKLETKLIHLLSHAFAVSPQQLQSCIDSIGKDCIKIASSLS